MLISRKPYEIERFRRNLWPTGYLCRVAIPIFKNNFLSCQIWQPFWIFEFFAKIAKHKNAYISKTVYDRAILMIFLIHRVSLLINKHIFPKKVYLTKNGSHFEFSNFSQKLQKQKCLYLENRARWSYFDEILSHRVSLQSNLHFFQKNFVSPKMAAILNFSKKLNNIKIASEMPVPHSLGK